MVDKSSEKLAIAIGHLYGDGGITSSGRVHYCNSEDFLINEFVNSMKGIFKVEPWIKKEENVTRIVYPVSVGRKLWELFGRFSFGKDTKIITHQIIEMPLTWKVKMLQAWFNDDGSVSNFPPNYKVVAIKQKLKPLTLFIKGVLNEFRINSQIIEDQGKWLLRVCGYENLINFRDNINFSVGYRKNNKLGEIIESINRPHFVTKKKILKLLEEFPKTIIEMAQLLDKSEKIVYGHLHGWKRKDRKSNKGLIDLGLVKVRKERTANIYILSSDSPSAGFGYSVGSDTTAQC